MKKKKLFEGTPSTVQSLGGEANTNLYIQELWQKLREYEDRLKQSSLNSSKSPSSDTPEAKAERKKLKRLVAEIRGALSQATRGTKDR